MPTMVLLTIACSTSRGIQDGIEQSPKYGSFNFFTEAREDFASVAE